MTNYANYFPTVKVLSSDSEQDVADRELAAQRGLVCAHCGRGVIFVPRPGGFGANAGTYVHCDGEQRLASTDEWPHNVGSVTCHPHDPETTFCEVMRDDVDYETEYWGGNR